MKKDNTPTHKKQKQTNQKNIHTRPQEKEKIAKKQQKNHKIYSFLSVKNVVLNLPFFDQFSDHFFDHL